MDHEYRTERGTAIVEQQTIAYREAAKKPLPILMSSDPPPAFDAVWEVDVSAVMLFRYSAITFNAHRIHYDRTYATGVESYDDVVVHGPLQATLLLNLAVAKGEGIPRRFAFRGVAPATGAQRLRVGTAKSKSSAALAVVSAAGVVTMTARAEW